MKTIKKEISKNKIKITVTVESEKMEKFFETEYNRLAPTVNLPGFRPGKAPRVMTIEAIGQTRLSQLALENGVNEGMHEALKEHKVRPVTQPSISISKYPAFGEDRQENELVFDIEFDILPKAKIGDFKKIKVKKTDPKNLEVTAEEVERVIEYLRRQAATMKEIEGAAKKGDWIQISFKGSIKHVEKDKLTSPSFPMVIGESNMIPGFEDELIGMKKGDKKEFDISFPKDFQDKEFAGEKAHFAVTFEEHKEIILPKVDDEFVARFGHKKIGELKTAVKNSLVQEKIERENQVLHSQIAEQVAKLTKVEIPQSLIVQESNRMKAQLEKDLQGKGLTLEKYLENVKITPEKMEQDLQIQAKRNILLGVGLGEIALKEGIEISEQSGVAKIYDRIIELCSK